MSNKFIRKLIEILHMKNLQKTIGTGESMTIADFVNTEGGRILLGKVRGIYE